MPRPHEFIFAGSSCNPKLGQPKPFDVDGCVNVSIQYGTTALVRPVTLLQCEVWADRPAHMTSFTGRRPPVDFHDGGAGVAGHPFQDGYELCKSEVRDLPPPQALYHVKIEVLDADDGIFAHKLVCQLEKPIAPAVADTLVDVHACKNAAATFFHDDFASYG